jgi:hypothetical protein
MKVTYHGAEGADQPGQVGEEVIFLLRVEEDLRMLTVFV